MPELPEVETVVRGLRDAVVGRVFTRTDIHWAREIARPSPQEFADRIAGQRVQSMDRRAKYIIFNLSADVLLVHLKMTGRLYVAEPQQVLNDDRWLRVTLAMDDGQELRFSDSRKFGRMYLVGNQDEVTGKLGPEPLSQAFTLKAFGVRVAKRSGAVKPLLLDQTFVAGVGNIYADEALWRSQINPNRPASTLSKDEIRKLHQAIRKVLADGIRYEGASVRWYRKPDGSKGQSQNHFNVYDQADRPCPRCGTPIRKVWLAQRGTHYCPTCQK
jgi:formamidopyrimidine-DNA glycosylase